MPITEPSPVKSVAVARPAKIGAGMRPSIASRHPHSMPGCVQLWRQSDAGLYGAEGRSPLCSRRPRSGEPILGELSSLEFDREDPRLEVPALDVGEARQDAEHRPIVGQDVGRESAQAAGLGRG